jgi:hypothetical protein
MIKTSTSSVTRRLARVCVSAGGGGGGAACNCTVNACPVVISPISRVDCSFVLEFYYVYAVHDPAVRTGRQTIGSCRHRRHGHHSACYSQMHMPRASKGYDNLVGITVRTPLYSAVLCSTALCSVLLLDHC